MAIFFPDNGKCYSAGGRFLFVENTPSTDYNWGIFSLDSKIIKDRVTIRELEEYRKVRKSLFKEYDEQPDYLKEIILSDLAKADAAWLCTYADADGNRIWKIIQDFIFDLGGDIESSFKQMLIDELTLNTRCYMDKQVYWENCGIALRKLTENSIKMPEWALKLNADEIDLLADDIQEMCE